MGIECSLYGGPLSGKWESSSNPLMRTELALLVGSAKSSTLPIGIPSHLATLKRPNFRDRWLPEHSSRTGPFGSTRRSRRERQRLWLVHLAAQLNRPLLRRMQQIGIFGADEERVGRCDARGGHQ